jgi:hypothetical protein
MLPVPPLWLQSVNWQSQVVAAVPPPFLVLSNAGRPLASRLVWASPQQRAIESFLRAGPAELGTQ